MAEENGAAAGDSANDEGIPLWVHRALGYARDRVDDGNLGEQDKPVYEAVLHLFILGRIKDREIEQLRNREGVLVKQARHISEQQRDIGSLKSSLASAQEQLEARDKEIAKLNAQWREQANILSEQAKEIAGLEKALASAHGLADRILQSFESSPKGSAGSLNNVYRVGLISVDVVQQWRDALRAAMQPSAEKK